jgi:hypothetical protein
MATVTPNFNWPVPTSTDLVKDGATAIEALGDSIDASLVDLKGGTTGQVLSKTSNTDMDFTWVAADDTNAIQNTIVDAKGDLIAASAADTPARLAVGNDGETLVADSSATTGLRYNANFAAGKNAVLNGDFNIWQRGTSFSVAGSTQIFGPDRFYVIRDGSGATYTMSQQTFTPGTAPVAGYEGTYFCRLNQSVAGTGGTFSVFVQKIEDVRKFAGQTVTLSFWAKANATIASAPVYLDQRFGSGGSGGVTITNSVSNITTSWQRFSLTYVVPSIAGKTIGAGSSIDTTFYLPINSTYTLDIWGVQLEAGSVATAFQTATGTIQGELAACMRYCQMYQPTEGNQDYMVFGGTCDSSAVARYPFVFPVRMRTSPTLTTSGTANNYANLNASGRQLATSVPVLDRPTSFSSSIHVASGGLSTGQATSFRNGDGTGGYLLFTAEL